MRRVSRQNEYPLPRIRRGALQRIGRIDTVVFADTALADEEGEASAVDLAQGGGAEVASTRRSSG